MDRSHQGSNLQVHKVDGPNQGQTYKSTKLTDPTKGQIYKSTKWTDTNQGQHHGQQSGRTQPGSNLQVHKMTDPTRVKLLSPQSGRIPPRVNTVQKVDEPNKGQTYTTQKKKKKEDEPYQRSRPQST